MTLIGTQYPLVNSPRGVLAPRMDVDQLKANILQLILTNPGERVMLPSFGTGLRKYIFEPNDTTLRDNVRIEISNAIQKWEPRILITDIEVSIPQRMDLNINDSLDEREAIILIKIRFANPDNIGIIEELELVLPSGQGTGAISQVQRTERLL